jgi:hypothetical protein
MSTGMGLKLSRVTAALDVIGGKNTFIRIPAESIVKVLPGSEDGHGMVSVLWESRAVKMFTIDLTMRGTEIKSRAAA